jgi:hypothetical protein
MAVTDYYWLAASIVLYVLVLILWPGIRRAWLIAGGMIAGAFMACAIDIAVIRSSYDGWSGVGPAIWTGTLALGIGGMAGFLLVFWWTMPAEHRGRPDNN